ncbi:MAG: ABC transporter permease [Bacteroidota bacterium]
MDDNSAPQQPRWPLSLLRRLLVPAYVDEIEGDLQEVFEEKMSRYPAPIARLLYTLELLSFLRPSLLKPRAGHRRNTSDKFRYDLKIAFRVFARRKLFTGINITGLTIGITAFVLILSYVRFESSYDLQHPNASDLYRVTLSNDGGANTIAANHPAVAAAMVREYPEVEAFARVVDKKILFGSFVLSYHSPSGEVIRTNANDLKIYIAEASLLQMFDIDLTRGDPETALTEPATVVISESTAQRFFGKEDPLDKILKIDNKDPARVTGVFKDLPENTHLTFDMLISFATLGDWVNTIWIYPEFYNYVRLHPQANPEELERQFPQLIQKYMSEVIEEHQLDVEFGLQKVSDIHLKSSLGKEISANSSEETLYFLLIIAVFVIAIAMINFINLSTAKSMERAKEVGLKKVVGAQRSALIVQFLLESLLVNLLGVMLSMALLCALIHPFNELVGLQVLSMDLWSEGWIWQVLASILVLGGLLAGAYPALVLSQFRPVQVLKGKYHQSKWGTILRKGLVVLQFTISIALMAGTFLVYHQFSFMQNKEVGYNMHHNVVINAPVVISDTSVQAQMIHFKSELERQSGVNGITLTNDIPGKRLDFHNKVRRAGEARDNYPETYLIAVDHEFLPTYEMKLLAGRNYRSDEATPFFGESEPIHPVIINRTLSEILGFLAPEDAVGARIAFTNGPRERDSRIIGVVEDHHQQSLRQAFEPTLLYYPKHHYAMYMTVNINREDWGKTLRDMEKAYAKTFPNDPFNFFFLEDQVMRQYEADVRFGKICLLFSILAIFIASLGLFGLGAYMAQQKIKEVSIRKVLGADLIEVLMLIPRSLLQLILVAGLVSLPLVYFAGHQWLSNFAFRVDITIWIFILPVVCVMFVALLAILFQSIRVAYVNPANTLRSE